MPKITTQNSGRAKGHSWFWDELDSYLEKNQLKQTRQREQIVEHFLALNDHLSAEELFAQLKETGLNIGLATIYRTLNLLVDAGLLEQKTFAEGKTLFEVQVPGEHHDHLVCVSCGKIIEFENEQIEELQEKVAKKYGFTLKSHRLDLFGHCKDCKK
jgi:Fur family ferric uptake transcriptional regulator